MQGWEDDSVKVFSIEGSGLDFGAPGTYMKAG